MSTKNAVYKTRRMERETRHKRERAMRNILWGALALVVVAVAGALVWFLARPSTSAQAVGEAVPVTSRDHIPLGTDPGPYSTDPPAEGHHYPSTYDPGFYSAQEVQALPKFYSGYLVHNLEHGYVIYWYNCQAAPKINCTDLQNAIKQVINANNSYKVIGFPWPSQKQPLVITSWGRILRLDKIDLATMRAYYKTYVDKGPEQTPD